MLRTLCILLCIITLGSCSRIRVPTRADIKPVAKSSLHLLNGTWYNTADSGAFNGEPTLWRQLRLRRYKKQPSSVLTVQIQVTGPHTLQARLMDGDKQVNKKTLRGRFKKGYFYLWPKSAFYGMVFLVWVSVDLTTRLATDGQGHLFADSEYAHGGGIFLFSAGTSDDWSCVYDKRQ